MMAAKIKLQAQIQLISKLDNKLTRTIVMTNQEIHNRLREAARSLGFANISIASNDVSEALRGLAENCFDIAAVCEALAKPHNETLQ
jgi:hypothetical protein